MRVGLVCPYSFDAPGGVQFHVRDLANELRRRGHDVQVFAPATQDPGIEGFVSAGGAIRVPYNGSVAPLCFGVAARARTKAWLAQANLDVLHIHEPLIPSVSLLALQAAQCPVVGTFHMATEVSYVYRYSKSILQRFSEKISAKIAVSEEARRTLVNHKGHDAIIIPNGVDVAALRGSPRPEWCGDEQAPVFVFLGRLDEPRKGLGVLQGAVAAVREKIPGARFLIAGRGDAERSLAALTEGVEILGEITDAQKADLLAGATAYIAPQTGGESFGIVLIEAMAAGVLVVASRIPAFDAVLRQGQLGRLFDVGDSADLAATLIDAWRDREGSRALAEAGRNAADAYDWGVITNSIMTVYEAVTAAERVTVDESWGWKP